MKAANIKPAHERMERVSRLQRDRDTLSTESSLALIRRALREDFSGSDEMFNVAAEAAQIRMVLWCNEEIGAIQAELQSMGVEL